MPVETALHTFRNPHNCAETVFYAFDSENESGHGYDLTRCGGGRAVDGQCGALFGGKLLLPEEKHETLEKLFVDQMGSAKCRELKRVHRSSCHACVETGARLVASLR